MGDSFLCVFRPGSAVSTPTLPVADALAVPVGALRDWERARATAPDFAVAYVRVIGQYPDMVAKAVA